MNTVLTNITYQIREVFFSPQPYIKQQNRKFQYTLYYYFQKEVRAICMKKTQLKHSESAKRISDPKIVGKTRNDYQRQSSIDSYFSTHKQRNKNQIKKSQKRCDIAGTIKQLVSKQKNLMDELKALKKEKQENEQKMKAQIIGLQAKLAEKVGVSSKQIKKLMHHDQLKVLCDQLKKENARVRDQNQILKIRQKWGNTLTPLQQQFIKQNKEIKKLEKRIKQMSQDHQKILRVKQKQVQIMAATYNSLKNQSQQNSQNSKNYTDIIIDLQNTISIKQKQLQELYGKTQEIVKQQQQRLRQKMQTERQLTQLAAQLQKQKYQLKERLAQSKQTINNLSILNEKHQQEIKKIKNMYMAKGEDELQLLGKVETLSQANLRYRQEIKQKNNQNRKIAQSLEKLLDQLSVRNQEIIKQSEEISNLKKENAKLISQNNRLEEENAQFEKYSETIKFVSAQMIDSLNKEVKALEKSNQSLRKLVQNGHQQNNKTDLPAAQLNKKTKLSESLFVSHPKTFSSASKRTMYDSSDVLTHEANKLYA